VEKKNENKAEITFCEMREKEIVNLYDGKRLGRVLDLVFDQNSNNVLGIVVPAIRRLFSRKSDDIFIPLDLIEKIGDDVILVRLEPLTNRSAEPKKIKEEKALYSEYSRELSVN